MIDLLFVPDESDLTGFCIDGRALPLDDINGAFIEFCGFMSIAFARSDLPAITQDHPVDIAVIFCPRIFQKSVVSCLGLLNMASFVERLVQNKKFWQLSKRKDAVADGHGKNCNGCEFGKRAGPRDAFVLSYEIQTTVKITQRHVDSGK